MPHALTTPAAPNRDSSGSALQGVRDPAAPGSPDGGEPFSELNARRLGPVRRFFVRRPVMMDVVVVLWFGVPTMIDHAMTATGTERWWLVLLTVAGAAALMWRRRWPVPVAATMAALAVLQVGTARTTSGFDLGIALAVYAVAANRPQRQAWTTAVAATSVVGVAAVLWERAAAGTTTSGLVVEPTGASEPAVSTSPVWLPSVTGLTLLVLAAISIGISVHNRRVHVAELVERANQLARDRDQQAQIATAAERTRIAREMHDVVAHSLTVMVALADGAGAALERRPDHARQALDEVSTTGRAALADMRRVLGVLNDTSALLDPQPSAPDIDALVQGFRTAGLPVEIVVSGGALPGDLGLQLAVYRIVQESLTNALRYATGTGRVTVRLTRDEKGVQVDVTDDGGIGTRPAQIGSGQGLIGMRERAAVYGGTVEAGPYRGGWHVHAELPWHEETTR